MTVQPYNRLVSQPETNVLLVEPLKLPKVDHELDSITRRYCTLTGFTPAAVKIERTDHLYQATILTRELGTIRGNGGQLVGKASISAGGRLYDTFSIKQLERDEIDYGPF